MEARKKDVEDQYLEYVDSDLVPERDEFLIQTHRPTKFKAAYHHHASVEINFLTACDLEYSFSGTRVSVPAGRMIIFWGSIPHGVTKVSGDGRATNIYLSLAMLLKWGLPKTFVDAIISGAVLSVKQDGPDQQFASDQLATDRWAKDYTNQDPAWRLLLLGEIQMRLRRLALDGFDVLMPGKEASHVDVSGGTAMRYIDEMLRFIADNYGNPLSVTDVADQVNLSPSYAMSLFRRGVGVPIKEHITRIRLSHAQMLLANSDNKILTVAMDSGFGSLSSFYEAFQAHENKTPAAFRRETRQ